MSRKGLGSALNSRGSSGQVVGSTDGSDLMPFRIGSDPWRIDFDTVRASTPATPAAAARRFSRIDRGDHGRSSFLP